MNNSTLDHYDNNNDDDEDPPARHKRHICLFLQSLLFGTRILTMTIKLVVRCF